MKKLLYLFIFLPLVSSADQKLSNLNATTTPKTTDYLYVVTNSSSVKVAAGTVLALPGASTSYPNLSNGLIPNSNVDGSSITKAGVLVAGSNITVSYGVGVTTIASTSSGGYAVEPATVTFQLTKGVTISTLTFVNSTTTGTVKSSAGVVTISTYALVVGLPCFADGAGSAVVAGSTRAFVVPFDCNLSSWTVIADTTGTISVDIKRASFANYPNYTSIVGGSGNKPSLTATIKNGATIASWTSTYLYAQDTVACVVDQSSTSTWWQVLLWGTKL